MLNIAIHFLDLIQSPSVESPLPPAEKSMVSPVPYESNLDQLGLSVQCSGKFVKSEFCFNFFIGILENLKHIGKVLNFVCNNNNNY